MASEKSRVIWKKHRPGNLNKNCWRYDSIRYRSCSAVPLINIMTFLYGTKLAISKTTVQKCKMYYTCLRLSPSHLDTGSSGSTLRSKIGEAAERATSRYISEEWTDFELLLLLLWLFPDLLSEWWWWLPRSSCLDDEELFVIDSPSRLLLLFDDLLECDGVDTELLTPNTGGVFPPMGEETMGEVRPPLEFDLSNLGVTADMIGCDSFGFGVFGANISKALNFSDFSMSVRLIFSSIFSRRIRSFSFFFSLSFAFSFFSFESPFPFPSSLFSSLLLSCLSLSFFLLLLLLLLLCRRWCLSSRFDEEWWLLRSLAFSSCRTAKNI